jgi:hypothetical protein
MPPKQDGGLRRDGHGGAGARRAIAAAPPRGTLGGRFRRAWWNATVRYSCKLSAMAKLAEIVELACRAARGRTSWR